ncbi:MAG: hypothetical protein RLZZ324_1096, partial [Candidatus Parcubacteria bacterium]
MDKTVPLTKKDSRSLFQIVVSAIVPTDVRFYDMLEEQAAIGCDATALLMRLGPDALAKVASGLQELEHKGDAVLHKLEEALAATFVTPLDREDIQKIASLLDDVLDNANAAARSCWMRGVDDFTPAMLEMSSTLHAASVNIDEAVSMLRVHDFAGITALARKVRALESQGDAVYQQAIHGLYHATDMDPIRLRREEKVLEAMELALNS